MKREIRKKGIIAVVILTLFLSNSRQISRAENVDSTKTVKLMEYVYDGNNRLVEVKKSGVTIAKLHYNKNGNLLRVEKIS